MLQLRFVRVWQRIALLIALAGALTACYDFDSEADADVAAGVVGVGDEASTDHELTGSVGDGPIVGAALSVLAKDGSLIASISSDSGAGYNVSVRTKGKFYPLTIRASEGTDLVTGLAPDFEMSSAVLEPRKRTIANINPHTTVAMEIARDLPGGLTANNIEAALGIAVREVNFGLDSLVSAGPMSKTIDSSNAAEIVKASETFGEAIRRTRDALRAVGRPASGDSVMQAIGSDLVDSVIDGRGGPRVNARIAAIFSLAAAQVNMEAIANRLRVNGAEAAGPMDEALRVIVPDTGSLSTTTVPITGRMLAQAKVGLAAAQALMPSTELEQLNQTLRSLSGGMLPADVANVVPANASNSLDNVMVSVADGRSGTLERINGVVRNDGTLPSENRAPTITGNPPASVAEGASYDFTPTADDPDGDALSFEVDNLPGWASFDTASGRLFGTPVSGDAGVYSGIVISVADRDTRSFLPAFSITVNGVAVNSPPTISGTPASTVNEGASYSFTPNADDADGDTLSFDIDNMPGWASFDMSSGRLFGTPGSGDAGTYANIVISVADQETRVFLSAFSITVNALAVNTPPTISGTPASTVNEGASYSFMPNANDADGDPLTFEVDNLPGWASFDTSSGRLFGTPGSGDAGTYSSIVISVADRDTRVFLPAFSITVEQVIISTGSATLSWTAPTENDDGTPLTDLAGYNIYWRATSGSLVDGVSVDNPGITTYVVDNLPSGTYEFEVTAFNAAGIESDRSNAATKTVP